MAQAEEIVIKPGHAAKNYWRDLLKSRELLWILAKRDLSVRYKQTTIGAGWALIRPFATTIVMVFAFGKVAKLKGDLGVPYPLMVLAGITIWSLFANTFTQISHSILLNSNLITKVYFPRLVMPLSSVVVGLVDFLISLMLFVIVAFWYQYFPTENLIYLPLFVLLTLLSSLAFGLFFSVVNVRFRDIAQLVPFLVQIGFYACPIAYSSSQVEMSRQVWWYDFYYLNPMVGIIDGFKWCLLGNASFFRVESLYSTVGFVAVVLSIAIYYFRRQENSFVDYI
ncbi:MAG: ABC transporter permease [Runella slithyformis]|jgi:lipopolysaccharide transport system permease protein|nr:MAG: ABC transporter permease [Runella slithyformis]TAF97210.1 MAG: ABC transporter permease [Runella sp.]TAG21938.1 MAG: ABC transporter permease [Cytophagales bacterium]TAG41118.1 MAG: ABC transporter permease [Cytophagia bacterium]TAF28972.1 MAG: ABC transporter permease [Runella slithyformis]